MVKGGAQSIDIAANAGVIGILTILFRRCVTGRDSECRCGGLGGRVDLRQPEIGQVGPVVFADDDILRLDIAMNDRRVLPVQVLERLADLVGPDQQVFLGNGFPQCLQGMLQHVCQVGAGDVIHRQALHVGFKEVGTHARQVGVVQPGQDARFPLELLDRLRADIVVHFDGHILLQDQVVGQIDDAKAALPKLPFDAVAAVKNSPLANLVRGLNRPSSRQRVGDCDTIQDELDRFSVGRTLDGVLLEQGDDQLVEHGREVWCEGRWMHRCNAQVLLLPRFGVVAFERELPGEGLVQDQAQGVQVRPRADGGSILELLGGAVLGSAEGLPPGSQGTGGVGGVDNAEIHNLEIGQAAAADHHQVGWFQVAVNNTVLVQVD